MPYKTLLAAFFLSVGAAAGDESLEMDSQAQTAQVLVEHLSTAQPSGFVPVTGPSGAVELRRSTVVDTLAPSDPQINDMWIDASAAGNYRTCIYTGVSWVETDGSGADCGTIHQRTLVVGATGSGSGAVFSLPGGIACGEACAKPFTFGEAVQLYAVPAEGSLFLGWSGCSGETAASISVLMDQDRVCGAEFATSVGIATADWSPGYTLYYDFEEVFAAGSATAEKRVPNWGTAGPSCDLRQYGSNLPLDLSEVAQQGGRSIQLKSLGGGVNQRLGVRTQSDAVNGSCEAARLGAPGAGYGSFSYHSRFRPQLNTESGATLSKISEIANGGPGGWAFEWQENGVVVGRAFDGSSQSAVVSPNGACPAGEWCVVSLVFDDPLDTFCLYVDGVVAACTGIPAITDPPTGSFAYYRFGSSSNSSKLDGLVDESGLWLGGAYTAEEVCRVCSCGIDGSLCSCDPLSPQLYSAGGGDGLNAAQCGGCALPACNREAP